MTRITIVAACVIFFSCFNPRMALSQSYYAPYLLLWHQNEQNQTQIQELQRQMSDVGVAIGALQKDLHSLIDLQQRLQDLEISNQNRIKTLVEELSKIQKEVAEIRKALNARSEKEVGSRE